MEGLTRLVSESLARHGLDRPLDYRRLHWSRWFRCESHHSLLFVPSKPGVFALAEEIVDMGTDHVGAASLDSLPRAESRGPTAEPSTSQTAEAENRRPEAASSRRMLAVTKFFEDDDMAYVLDRMVSRQNPLHLRLTSGRYFVRFVVIEDVSQRRSICSALNQWIANSSEKATGIASHFASSLELTPKTEYVPNDVGRAPSPASVETAASAVPPKRSEAESAALSNSTPTAPLLHSGAATHIQCPPFPSGF